MSILVRHPSNLLSCAAELHDATMDILTSADCAVILTDHSNFDYPTIVAHSQLILDCRKRFAEVPYRECDLSLFGAITPSYQKGRSTNMQFGDGKSNGSKDSDIQFQPSRTNLSASSGPGPSLPLFVPHILVVDDEEQICGELERCLIESGYSVSTRRDAGGALKALEEEHVDLVVTDVRLPGMSGVELTKQIVERWPDVPVIVITGYGEIDIAVEVLKLGASDFIRKPFSPAAIDESIKVVLEKSRVFVDIRHLRNDLRARYEFGGMLSRTAEMHRVFETIRMVAETDATVVIEGETGTGKDLVARAIHHQSARKEGPFVAINCSGVPETLLESELFGCERGAFTGADRARPGKIELAHGGTLFLDEIESMPLSMQAKLLLVLETQKVQRLGSNRWTQIDMRVVAATNIPLRELRNKGVMRSDFYFRLNVIVIPLFPLRKRIEDIPILVQDFLQHHPIAVRRNITKISTQAMERLMKYDWPGNIRELQNVLEKAIVLSRSRAIEKVELPEGSLDSEAQGKTISVEVPLAEEAPLDEWVKDQERRYLMRRLQAFRGKIGPTAKSCGVDVRTIYRKMRLYGLDKKDFSTNSVSNYSKLARTRRITNNRVTR